MIDILDHLSLYLGVTSERVVEIAETAPATYKMMKLPKSNGGFRIVYKPSVELKCLQNAIVDLLLGTLPVHSAAAAYVRGSGSPILRNAERHLQRRLSLRLDCKDFFPSIRPDDFRAVMKNNGALVDEKTLGVLQNLLFVKYPDGQYGLAVGAPSSPVLSNLVMVRLDEVFTQSAAIHSAIYSRYSDDFVFSFDQEALSERIEADVVAILRNCTSPRLSLNQRKTRYFGRGARRTVTGLVLTQDQRVSIGRDRKRYFRSLTWKAINGQLSESEIAKFRGYLAFARQIEPDYINSLIVKFGIKAIQPFLPAFKEKRRGSD